MGKGDSGLGRMGVIGIIKSVTTFRRFLPRGVNNVRGECYLVCLAYNVKRMHRMQWT